MGNKIKAYNGLGGFGYCLMTKDQKSNQKWVELFLKRSANT